MSVKGCERGGVVVGGERRCVESGVFQGVEWRYEKQQ